MDLEGSIWSRVARPGRTIHERENGLASDRIFLAKVRRMLLGSRIESWRKSNRAVNGRLPPRMQTTSSGVALEALQTLHVMAVEDILLRLVENLGDKAAEESGDAIEELNTKGGSRVTAVPFGKA